MKQNKDLQETYSEAYKEYLMKISQCETEEDHAEITYSIFECHSSGELTTSEMSDLLSELQYSEHCPNQTIDDDDWEIMKLFDPNLED